MPYDLIGYVIDNFRLLLHIKYTNNIVSSLEKLHCKQILHFHTRVILNYCITSFQMLFVNYNKNYFNIVNVNNCVTQVHVD